MMYKKVLPLLLTLILAGCLGGCASEEAESKIKLNQIETQAALNTVATVTAHKEVSQTSAQTSRDLPTETESESATEDASGQDLEETTASEAESQNDQTEPEKSSETDPESSLEKPKRLIPGEAKVPLSQVDPEAATGVAGYLTQGFFDAISADPLYFSYREWSLPQKGKDKEQKQIQEMLLLLSTDRVYLKLIKGDKETVIVKPTNSAFYLLDRENYAAIKIDVKSDIAKQISAYAFGQLGKSAGKLAFTGTDQAVFHGKEAKFEEFRNGQTGYVRYYYDADGNPLGHRIIEAGKLTSDIEIIELKNTVDERFFEIPAIYDIINE